MVYANKFCDETWAELEKRKLVSSLSGAFPGFVANQGLAHLMMAILADNCASFTRATVTDVQSSYDRICNILAVEVESLPIEKEKPSSRILATTPVLSMQMENVPIENLIRLREQEHKAGGHHYTLMRHKLYDKVREWSNSYAQPHYTLDDRREVFRNCEVELKRDFSALREELVKAGTDFVLSTDMYAFVPTTVAALATGGWLGPILTIPAAGILKRMQSKYQAARYKALDGHFTSYLYLAKQRHFEQDVI